MLTYSSTTTDDGILIIKPSGKLETYTADDFFNTIQEQLENGTERIVIDCSQLEYLSSVGVGTLVRIHHRAKKHNENAQVVYAALKDPVSAVIHLVHLDKLLGVYPNTTDACNALK